MPRIKRHRVKGSERALDQAKALRGLDREHHFKNGGTLVEWRGGPRLIQKNKKRLIPRHKKNRGRVEL